MKLLPMAAAAATTVATAGLAAGEETYPPGTFRLAPQIDLHQEAVRLQVPPGHAGVLPPDATLGLPPGFTVGVFAARGLGNPARAGPGSRRHPLRSRCPRFPSGWTGPEK